MFIRKLRARLLGLLRANRTGTFAASSLAAVAVLVILVIVLVTPDGRSPPQSSPSRVQLADSSVQPVTFDDVTLESGVIFSHLQGDEHLTGLNETLGSGACAFDYDNDGWIDIFLVNGTGLTRYYGSQHWWHLPKGHALYRNTHDGHFEDVTARAGLNELSWGMGCTSADFDNDGHTDLLITNYGSVSLYRNQGNGAFSNVTAESGMLNPSWATTASLADFDNDGLLDVYIVNYLDFEKAAHTYEGNSQYIREFPRAFNSALYSGVSDRLYRNLGSFKFEDVTNQAGVRDASGRGLSAAWFDANADRRPDLYVANDVGTTSQLYLNDGAGHFQEAGLSFRLNDAHGAHSISLGDIDNDGRLDAAVSTLAGEPPVILIQERDDVGKPIFRNRSRQLGIGSDEQTPLGGWGIELADLNNDGTLDLFQASGLPVPDPLTHKIAQGQPNRVWLQNTAGRFIDSTEQAGTALLDTQSGRGVAVLDFDNDGKLDVYIAHNNDLGQLLHNRASSGHWLGVRLQGVRSNRDAIGAVVSLRIGGRTQRRTVASGGFLSTNDRRVHFGWKENSPIEELTVVWPSGAEDSYRDLPSDAYIQIVEGGSTAKRIKTSPSRSAAPTSPHWLGAERAEYRVQYLQWLSEHSSSSALAEMRAGIRDPDTRVRLQVISNLRTLKSPEGLSLLVTALSDSSADVRLAALDAVREHEDEASIRWLLRMFSDRKARVRTALAESFAFFYRKEEAVIYRKYLALPHLIRLLADDQADVRRAAAHAIGEAKRFEGIDPLLAMLKDPVEAVRAESVCSLGLIRDRKALSAIEQIAEDAKQPPMARAHALIALRRLNAQSDTELRRWIDKGLKDSDTAALIRTLSTLDEIFGNTIHGVVLNRALLVDALKDAIQARHFRDRETRSRLVQTLRLAGGPMVKPLILQLTRDSDPSIRASAFVSLMEIDRSNRAAYAASALMDSSLDAREMVLNILLNNPIAVSARALEHNLNEPSTQSRAIVLLRGTQDEHAVARLYAIASDTTAPASTRAAALEALSFAETNAPPATAAMLENADGQIRAAAVRYWAARLPFYFPRPEVPNELLTALRDPDRRVMTAAVETLLARHEAWARSYLISTLLNQNADLGIRRKILDAFAEKQDEELTDALIVLAERDDDSLRFPATSALRPFSKEARSLLWHVLRDAKTSVDLRFAAARRLMTDDPDQVLEIIREGQRG